MAKSKGSNKAQQEKEYRRKMLRQRQQQLKANNNWKKATSEEDYTFFTFSTWRMRRIAPIAMLIYCSLILFGVFWLISSKTDKVCTTNISIDNNQLGKFQVRSAGGLYRFELSQIFSSKTPLYSELEIEILDANYDHVYSIYKDLWQEKHSNGDGGRKTYSDKQLAFELELENAGTYFIRGVSHNNYITGKINCTVLHKTMGSLYFRTYTIAFAILAVLLIMGKSAWGNPVQMLSSISKAKSLKKNKLFWRVFLGLGILFVTCLIISLTHYGYASGGGKSILPTYFYGTDSVIYLG